MAMEVIIGGLIHVVLFPGEELVRIDVVLAIALNFVAVVVEALVGLEKSSGLFTHINKFIS